MSDYTQAVAAEEPTASIRKARGSVPHSRLLDGILGILSVPYAVLCVILLIVGRLPCGDFGCFLLAGVRRPPVPERSATALS